MENWPLRYNYACSSFSNASSSSSSRHERGANFGPVFASRRPSAVTVNNSNRIAAVGSASSLSSPSLWSLRCSSKMEGAALKDQRLCEKHVMDKMSIGPVLFSECTANFGLADKQQVIYQNTGHFIESFPTFEHIRRQGKFCDVTLKVRNNL
jgi:hypothetical protein